MIEENFLITICNRQKIEGEIEEINLTTRGSYTEKNGKKYIVYREYDPENQNGQTSTLKVDPTGSKKIVSLIRHDPTTGSTNLVLEEGTRHQCQYGTAYGSLSLGVFTSKIDDQLTDNGGSILMEYTLDVNTNLSSMNAITVTVKPAAQD